MENFLYTKDVYEEDYLTPYHWTMDPFSFSGMQYFGYQGMVVDMLQSQKGKKVLDIGCGDGRFCSELIKKGFVVTGLDFSGNAICHSKRMVPEGKFINANILEDSALSEISDDLFDVVSVIEVVEHIPPEFHGQLIQKVHDMLDKEGILVYSVPSIKYPLTNCQHYKHFTLEDACELVQGAGLFEVEKVVGNHHQAFLKIRGLLRFIDNKCYDLKLARKIFSDIYNKKFRTADLQNACRYIIKARKV